MAVNKPKPLDYLAIYEAYKGLDNGLKAQVRRIAEPDDLRETPAFYKLFPVESQKDRNGRLRVAFLLPWLDDCGDQRRNSTPSFGNLLAKAGISEMRVFQVARASAPDDLKQLRRLAIQLKTITHAKLDWREFGAMLYFWNKEQKRRLIESYFLAQYKPTDTYETDHE